MWLWNCRKSKHDGDEIGIANLKVEGNNDNIVDDVDNGDDKARDTLYSLVW